jgi:3-deoxy-D-manno-octulosonic-acid transferase
MLGFADHFFVQDNNSEKLLRSIGINSVTVSGDTRFDRVFANALHPKELPAIRDFKNIHKVFICGSTWPEDEALLTQLVNIYPDWKFVFAPHEISEDRIARLIEKLPLNTAVRYSTITEPDIAKDNYQSLIVDNIGMLSSIYQYGEVAYIGGGFGAGIHNTLEAAAFGLPVVFGPNYTKFKEAKDLIKIEAAFSIKNIEELKGVSKLLMQNEEFYNSASLRSKQYVEEHTGATEEILNHIKIGKQ